MKVVFLILPLLFAACLSNAECRKKPIVIAVVDTGFGYKDKGHTAHLCKYGHRDFTIDRQFSGAFDVKAPIPLDTNGHGTNIAGIIDGYASKVGQNFCIVVIKYFSDLQTSQQNVAGSKLALQYALNIKADVINYSGGGEIPDEFEFRVVKKYLDSGFKIVAAAGNEKSDLAEKPYFPAMYDKRIVVVGSIDAEGNRSKFSNYGIRVNRWEVGEKVTAYGETESGTSQATAIATGKIVAEKLKACDR